MDINSLRSFLLGHNVPLMNWGEGKAKALDSLFAELEAGESTLASKNGIAVRSISAVALDVYYTQDSQTLLLVEERQVFNDGRCRSRNLSTSLGEKIKLGETPIAAARRALEEELGISEDVTFFQGPVTKKLVPSPESYPGLCTDYVLHGFEVFLPTEFYDPDGYVEQRPDLTTYFVWKLHTM